MNGILAVLLAVIEPLWPSVEVMPGYEPHQVARMSKDKSKNPIAYLDWYEPPANPNGGVIILISGGAYNKCCDDMLVNELWPKFWNELGFQCVNLVYRTPRSKTNEYYRTAWIDGQRAVRKVRAEAAKRGLDVKRIGAMGMSAGAHLTALLATSSLTPAYEPVDELDKEPCNLDFAVPAALPYGLTDSQGTASTRGGNGVDCFPTDELKFDEATCPACLLHGGADKYSPEHSAWFYKRMRRAKVPAEIHIFPNSGHGTFWTTRNWQAFVRGFIRQLNLDKQLGGEVDLLKRYPYTKDAELEKEGVMYERELIWGEDEMPDVQTNQCTPHIDWYIPTNLTTKAIQIIYSGGAYGGNHPEGFEVAPLRRYLNAKGMAVVTLKYRTPRPAAPLAKHTTAWQDLQRAIKIVRTKAAEKGLDGQKIGIMGSSAGGHLTLMGVTSSRSHSYYEGKNPLDRTPCNVQWAIAIYPAYSLTDGINGGNKRGGNDDDIRLAPEFAFDPDTCPTLFMHGDSDPYASMASVKCWSWMRRMGVQSEVHTLVKRSHCFHRKAAEGTTSYEWMERVEEFLRIHKWL